MQASDETIEGLIAQLRSSGGGKPPPPVLRGNDGGGKLPDVPEEALKSRVDFLHTAFLWLAGALVTAVIGVIAIAVTMTNATNTRLDTANDRLSSLNREVGQVSGKVDEANRGIDRMDKKLDQIVGKIDKR